MYVPRGVANGYQALATDTVYSYLVNEHWSPDARDSYTYLNLADETVAIPWPIPLSQAEISAADAAHPRLADVTPMAPKRTVVVGAKGQLGRALTALLPDALGLDLPEFDLRDPAAIASVPWGQVGTIINAAAYTAVDAAETLEGRRACWDVNVACLGRLVDVARNFRTKLSGLPDGTSLSPTVLFVIVGNELLYAPINSHLTQICDVPQRWCTE